MTTGALSHGAGEPLSHRRSVADAEVTDTE